MESLITTCRIAKYQTTSCPDLLHIPAAHILFSWLITPPSDPGSHFDTADFTLWLR